MAACCEPHNEPEGGHFRWLGSYTELYFSLASGFCLLVGFLLEIGSNIISLPSVTAYLTAYFFGGFFTFLEAIKKLRKGIFEIDFLMLVAAIGAAYLGKWAEGALLLFLFSLGHALEHYAMGKARRSIAALTDLAPKTALVKINGDLRETDITNLSINDTIVVRPNSKIPADGFIVSGESSVNQAPITGESVPVDKIAVLQLPTTSKEQQHLSDIHRVFAGTINGNATLEITVTKKAEDSTLSRLITMVEEAKTQKSPTQLFTDRFEKYYVPLVLLLVVLLNFAYLVVNESWSDSFYRAMAVLVAASPCALAISTPSAVLSGIARAARGGVLIKGGKPLEDLGSLTAIAFDKTGTLTEGSPKITDVIPFQSTSKGTLLEYAIAVESLSDHPLARAVVRDGLRILDKTSVVEAQNLESVHGKGIVATYNEEKIHIGNRRLYETMNISIPREVDDIVTQLESAGKTTMLLKNESAFFGVLGLMDTPRPVAKKTLAQLRLLGIKRMVMLTGDNQLVANSVAQEIGVDQATGGLLPEEKVAAIQKLKKQEKKLAMVGDGVNDAPAMAHSTVGIAMGAAGSDVALETADIALMADKLETLPFAIGLSRMAKTIIKENLWISLGMVAILVPATIFSWVNIGVAVFFHEGSTLLVVLNALRLLAYAKPKP